jgi:hypothetical protein
MEVRELSFTTTVTLASGDVSSSTDSFCESAREERAARSSRPPQNTGTFKLKEWEIYGMKAGKKARTEKPP